METFLVCSTVITVLDLSVCSLVKDPERHSVWLLPFRGQRASWSESGCLLHVAPFPLCFWSSVIAVFWWSDTLDLRLETTRLKSSNLPETEVGDALLSLILHVSDVCNARSLVIVV